MVVFLLVLLSALGCAAYQVVLAINCGSAQRTIINSKFFNYTLDSYYEGLASTAETKNILPQSVTNQIDRQLIKNHRTTSAGYSQFSYRPILTEGFHIAIFSMIQTQYKLKGERIMKIKLGDQLMHTVDIISQVGPNKILHKWIQFDIRDDIVFINGTLPTLNAFNFKTKQVKFVFEGVKNKPKIQNLVLLKGNDAQSLLKQFIQNEQQKNVRVKQYISEKYRKQPKLSYRPMQADDIIPPPESQIYKLYNKYMTFRTLGSLICGIVAIHHQKIGNYLIEKYKSLIKKYIKKPELQAKKKQ